MSRRMTPKTGRCSPTAVAAPLGPNSAQSVELLGSAPMMELMTKLWREFDYVIVDTHPSTPLPIPRSLHLGQRNILIVEQGRQCSPRSKHAKGMLDRVNANTIGVVITRCALGVAPTTRLQRLRAIVKRTAAPGRATYGGQATQASLSQRLSLAAHRPPR